jgi:hypothetical protein
MVKGDIIYGGMEDEEESKGSGPCHVDKWGTDGRGEVA